MNGYLDAGGYRAGLQHLQQQFPKRLDEGRKGRRGNNSFGSPASRSLRLGVRNRSGLDRLQRGLDAVRGHRQL